MDIYLMRHGQTDLNAKKLMQGEDAADPYEEFIKEAERTKANG